MHLDRLDLNEFCFIFGNIPRPEQKEESPIDSPSRKKKLDKNSLTVDTGNKISLKE